jgi:hypothetical protein
VSTRQAADPARETHFLEHGHIYFAYRPRVDATAVTGVDDVQRTYMILSPRGKASYRLIIIAQKRLPAMGREGDRRAWGFVEKVSSQPEEVENELDPKTYLTKTRGERHRPAARPAGEGVYAIVRHRNHTHLACVLELPETPGEVQRALNIQRDGSYIVTVRNPKAPAAVGSGLDAERRAHFPRNLQQRFRGRRFIPLDPPDFLDHAGAEIVIIGAKPDVARTLGIELNPEHETPATAEIFTDLRLEQSVHPIRPLVEGTWE